MAVLASAAERITLAAKIDAEKDQQIKADGKRLQRLSDETDEEVLVAVDDV